MNSLNPEKPGTTTWKKVKKNWLQLKKLRDADGAVIEHYFNRELSFLLFNGRVLDLARDPTIPLLERLRFLCISSTNLDEFFEVRVSGLKQHIAYDVGLSGPEELTPREVFRRVSTAAHQLVSEQYRVLNDVLLPSLRNEGIHVLKREEWTDDQAEWIRGYFVEHVLPVLTPIALDPSHPFPQIVNKSLNFIVSVKGKDAFGRRTRTAVVQAPRLFPRLIALPPELSLHPHDFVMVSSVIHDQMDQIFPGMKVSDCYQFRVTRDSDLWVDEEEIDDLLLAIKDELLSRRFAGASRLEVADNCTEEMNDFLLQRFNLSERDLYRVNGPVNLHRLSALYDVVDRPDLKYRPYKPGKVYKKTKTASFFEAIREGDILLHHPFQSFKPVVDFLREAARDPDVVAIKQTVYRTGVESPLAKVLLDAATAGKEVTAVIELRARFDEAANIELATRLQEAGAKVVYGIVGYKAHAKLLMVLRREGDTMNRYVHLGTGNYHTGTTRAYTDFGLFTCDEAIGQDVHNVFQQLTGLGKVRRLNKLVQSPFNLYSTIIECIENEIAVAEAGRKARIIAKMNALIEPNTIAALYRASHAGVQIDLIVRGICCLVPGVKGISENIRVRSILGRFLEHSRVFYFLADGEERVFCSSADWMPRNFFRRVEICFPIESAKLKNRVIDEGLKPYLEDNCHAWTLQSDGAYVRESPGDAPPLYSQEALLESLAEDPGLKEDDLRTGVESSS
jgi:polyphosphate kinase